MKKCGFKIYVKVMSKYIFEKPSSNEKNINLGGTFSVKFGIYVRQMAIFRGGIR